MGIGKWGTGGTSGAAYAFFTDTAARQILLPGQQSGYFSAWVVTDQKSDITKVSAAVTSVLPPGYEAENGKDASKDAAQELEKALGFMNTFFLVFAGISLLVAAFLIFNTFSIIVNQREKELALYRALGASKRQVQISVLLEAFIVAILGATLGLLLGLGLATGISQLVAKAGYDLGTLVPRITGAAVVASFGIGIVLTMFSAWVPAKRAGRVDPIVAMTGQNTSVEKVSVGVSLGSDFGFPRGGTFPVGIYTRYSEVSIYWCRFRIYFISGRHHFAFAGAPDYLAIRKDL